MADLVAPELKIKKNKKPLLKKKETYIPYNGGIYFSFVNNWLVQTVFTP